MKSRRSKQFLRLFEQLPIDIQKQAYKAYEIFSADPYHPSLHFKEIDARAHMYSVRIGRRYRAIGRYEGNQIEWVWIGSHEDYNNL
jgi:plasmid maintenance system killer protein